MLRRLLAVTSCVALVAVAGFGFTNQQKQQLGYEMNTYGMDVVGGNVAVAEALCGAGKKVMGGGYKIGPSISSTGPDPIVYESSPRATSGPAGWRIEAANRGTTTRHFDVWVICANM